MSPLVDVTLIVNGKTVRRAVEPRRNLVDFLREELDLTGSHVGCEHGVCGACTVRVDGGLVRGCLMLAVQADGCRVDTIEGVSERGEIAALQRAFREENALHGQAQLGSRVPETQAQLHGGPHPNTGSGSRARGYDRRFAAPLAARRFRAR